jgi:hypothetical protein
MDRCADIEAAQQRLISARQQLNTLSSLALVVAAAVPQTLLRVVPVVAQVAI